MASSLPGRYTLFFTLFISLLFALGMPAHAVAEELSPAEQEALALAEAQKREHVIKLCQHTLLYGTPEAKADLLEVLGAQTCSEAADAESTGSGE